MSFVGDVNNDGMITDSDLTILSRHLANWGGYESDKLNLAAADINNDGVVNNFDRLTLTRYLSDWDIESAAGTWIK